MIEENVVKKKEPIFSRRVNITILVAAILYSGFNTWIYLSVGIPISAFFGRMIGWTIRGFIISWAIAFVLTRVWKLIIKKEVEVK